MMKCCTEKSPKLNHRITIERLKNNQTLEGGGQPDETDDANWTAAGTDWAEFITQGSREFFRGEEIAADITHQVTLRYSTTAAKFTKKMRLRMDGRRFNIAEPPRNIDEKNNWLVFKVIEKK